MCCTRYFVAMFSKALLLLAVCLQALRTGNAAQHVERIKGGWQIGKSVNVDMRAYEHEHPNCKIWLQENESGDTGDKQLISFVGTTDRVLINAYANGKWQSEDNDYGIDIRKDGMKVDIIAEKDGFKIKFKGKEYFRKYDFPLEKIKYMKGECPNESEMTLNSAWHKDCTCKSK